MKIIISAMSVIIREDVAKDVTVKAGGWPNIPATKKYTISLYKRVPKLKHPATRPTKIPRPIKVYTVDLVKKITSENKPKMLGRGEGWIIRTNGILTYDEANHQLVWKFDVTTTL